MRILAVECSEPRASIALLQDGEIVANAQSEPRRAHGGQLLVEIDALLRKTNLSPADIDVFAASAGPGSFTGVRVGLSTIRALAWPNQRPCTALNTLDILAHGSAVTSHWISPVLDARKQEVYAALYRLNDGAYETVLSPCAVDPAEWLLQVGQQTDGSIQYVGSGTSRYPEHFSFAEAASLDCAPEAAVLATLVAGRITVSGVEGLPPAIPCYIRPSEAEVKFGAAPAFDPKVQIASHDKMPV